MKKIACPIENTDAACKFYVDSGLNDPSITRRNAHVDLNDKNFYTVRFVRINSLPAVREHLIPKFYVDKAISHSLKESSLLRSDSNEKLN